VLAERFPQVAGAFIPPEVKVSLDFGNYRKHQGNRYVDLLGAVV